MAARAQGDTFGARVMALAALGAVALSVYNYVTPLTGINGTPGAILVIASSALLVVFAIILMMRGSIGAGLYGFVLVSSLLAIAGTAFPGLLLETTNLVWIMTACLVGWLFTLLTPVPRRVVQKFS